MARCSIGFERNPFATKAATSVESLPRVSGKYIFNKTVSRIQTLANIRNTEGPIAFCRVGNVIPTIKLQLHEDKLPKDIAAERGATSNNSDPIKNGIGPSPSW